MTSKGAVLAAAAAAAFVLGAGNGALADHHEQAGKKVHCDGVSPVLSLIARLPLWVTHRATGGHRLRESPQGAARSSSLSSPRCPLPYTTPMVRGQSVRGQPVRGQP
jgi:hypothetical protein